MVNLKKTMVFQDTRGGGGRFNYFQGAEIHLFMGLVARKPVFGGLRTAKAQTSLRIRAV